MHDLYYTIMYDLSLLAYMISLINNSNYMPCDMEYDMMSLYAICMLCVYGVIQLSCSSFSRNHFFRPIRAILRAAGHRFGRPTFGSRLSRPQHLCPLVGP